MAANTKNAKKQSGFRSFIEGQIEFRTILVIAVLILLVIIFSVLTKGNFITSRNISNLLRQTSIWAIMGLSMCWLIVTMGIDLSAGMAVGFLSCFIAVAQVKMGMGTIPSLLLTLVVALVLYAIQGYLVSYIGMAAFIVTLGGQLALKGGMLLITGSSTVAPVTDGTLIWGQAYVPSGIGYILAILAIVGAAFTKLRNRSAKIKNNLPADSMAKTGIWIAIYAVVIIGAAYLMCSYKGIPVPVLVMLILALIMNFISTGTTFGRSIYSIGGNIKAAEFAGIKVKRNMFIMYLIHGAMMWVAGVILVARLNAGSTSSGLNYELDAIASTVIGGTSFLGGIGKPAGAILGALVMCTIDNGLSTMNVDAAWQYVSKGLIIVFAVLLDQIMSSRKKG
ncbi:MAG: sugar ABC transporter permease [Lachnospiraceae bacterium]|nr:sugar ABC transporter permease [Lachnospiraceae bacterium]